MNQSWFSLYTQVESLYLPPSLSDHSSILIDMQIDNPGHGRPFRFLNCLADHADFNPTVEEHWAQMPSRCPTVGRWNNLKVVKHSLKNLNTKKFSNVADRVTQAQAHLLNIQN